MHRVNRLLLLSAVCLAVPAMAQYRATDAEVITPPPPPPPPGMVAADNFRAVYAKARRPRILIFWNRELSEEVRSQYRDNLHVETRNDSRASASDDVSQSRLGTSRLQEATASSRSSLDASVGTDRLTTSRDGLDETTNFAVEAAFSETLAANGAVLIDRNLAMRTSRGARKAGERANMQDIETEAATSRADLLIEVLQSPAPGTPTGAAFKVTVKDIRAARLLAAFTSTGAAPRGRAPLVAGPGGFVRATAMGTSPGGAGHELANRTMAELARSLR